MQYATVEISAGDGPKFYGIGASFYAYQLYISLFQGTSSRIILTKGERGPKKYLNAVEAGWHVTTGCLFVKLQMHVMKCSSLTYIHYWISRLMINWRRTIILISSYIGLLVSWILSFFILIFLSRLRLFNLVLLVGWFSEDWLSKHDLQGVCPNQHSSDPRHGPWQFSGIGIIYLQGIQSLFLFICIADISFALLFFF